MLHLMLFIVNKYSLTAIDRHYTVSYLFRKHKGVVSSGEAYYYLCVSV